MIRNHYLAPHSFILQVGVDPEIALTSPGGEIGVSGDLTPGIIAVNPWRLLETFISNRPIEQSVKTFISQGVSGTVGTPQGVSGSVDIKGSYMNSENLNYIAGSEFCADGYIAIDAFIFVGASLGRSYPLKGNLNDLLNGKPYDFYGAGLNVDQTTNQIVYINSVGIVVGANAVGNGVDGEISVSPGTNITHETSPFWK